MSKEETKEEVKEETKEETVEEATEEKKEPSSDEIIEGLKAELDKAKNDVARAYADTENMKKRLQKDADATRKYRFQQPATEILTRLLTLWAMSPITATATAEICSLLPMRKIILLPTATIQRDS